jgi:hypothetical protein
MTQDSPATTDPATELAKLRALIREAFNAPLPSGRYEVPSTVVLLPLAAAYKLKAAGYGE